LVYDRQAVGAGTQALITRVGDRLCALPIELVEETMRRLRIETTGTSSFVLGVAIIRGRPTPVVDTAKLVGTISRGATRFVTLRVGDRRVALAVDEVIDVRVLPAGELPPLVAGDIVTALAALDRELVIVLDAARIIAQVPA
jgi:purine-binding chemotaxis protein CheW